MIKRVEFRNFKGLRHVDLDLERLTVIVGPNASGKTSILAGLDLFSKTARLSALDHFQTQRTFQNPVALEEGLGLSFLHCRSEKGAMEIAIFDESGGMRFRAEPVGQPMPSGIRVDESIKNAVTWVRSIGMVFPDHHARVSGNEMDDLFRVIRSSAMLRLEATRLAEPSYYPDPNPKVEHDGTNLASVLASMALGDREEFERIEQLLASVISTVRRIKFQRMPIVRLESEKISVNENSFMAQVRRNYLADSILIDFVGAADIPANLVSEGTLLVLGLLTALAQKPRPRLILLDDLDRGLHPKAQRDFMGLLKRFLEQNPDVQIIATTHSPYLLDNLDPKEVRLTNLNPDGSVSCARLDEHSEFERWKDEMLPGEFWSLVGEKWVTEARNPEHA